MNDKVSWWTWQKQVKQKDSLKKNTLWTSKGRLLMLLHFVILGEKTSKKKKMRRLDLKIG